VDLNIAPWGELRRSDMERNHLRSGVRLVAAGAAVAGLMLVGAATAGAQPQVEYPKPTVPQIFTVMGQFVRVAYNNQGFVTLGYRAAQESVGQDWLLLEVGLSMMSGAKDYRIKRENFTLKTPDGTVIPLATQKEYAEAGYLRALNNRTKVQRDPINYFPIDVTRGCSIAFFANPGERGRQLAFDEVELSYNRGCVGRLYFKVPGGIKVGQHWLIVHFGESEVQTPFRILTPEERKEFAKSWQEIKKAHDATYK
jgi:hypothetical protein